MGTLLDIHLHTSRYSPCSRLSPRGAVKRAIRIQIDGIVITEHYALWTGGEIADLVEKTKAWNFRVLVGQELRGYREDGSIHGDILAFGFYQKVEGLHPTQELIEMIQEAGGVALAAHPYRHELGLGDDVYQLSLDGIEVFTPHHLIIDTMKAERAWKELKIAGIGGSDAHRRGDVGRCLTYFENSIKNEMDLVNEIKARRCKPVSYQEVMKLRP